MGFGCVSDGPRAQLVEKQPKRKTAGSPKPAEGPALVPRRLQPRPAL